MKRIPALLAGLCLSSSLLAGCAATTATAPVTSTENAEYFSQRDSDSSFDETSAIHVDLSQLERLSDTPGVQVDGTQITLTQEGAYLIEGQLADGSLVVDAPSDAKVHLILRDASLSSTATAPLQGSEADKIFITLEGESSLTTTAQVTETSEDTLTCALSSTCDLSLNGTGSLEVSSALGNGIDCKDDLVIASGTYVIDAGSHGLEANDSICLKEVTLQVTSGKDGLHVENNDDASKGYLYVESGSLTVGSQGDGASASSWMKIAEGSLTITSGGGVSSATPQATDAPPQIPQAQEGQGDAPQAPGLPGAEAGEAPSAPTGQRRPHGQNASGEAERPPFENGQEPPALPDSSAPAPPEASASANEIPSGSRDAAATSSDEETTSAKGLKAGTSLDVVGGTLTIDSADDALHSNGNLTISGGEIQLSSGDDGAHADESLTLSGGTTAISRCYEGLEGQHLSITGGTLDLTASDDGLNASEGSGSTQPAGPAASTRSNCAITISGGTVTIDAGGDAIDSNGSLEITGGTIVCQGPTQGDTSILDFDTSGTIAGGTFVGTGAAQMMQTLTSTTQGVLTVRTGAQAAGTSLTVKDQTGTVIQELTPAQPFELLILSSQKITPQATYTIEVGGDSLTAQAS